MLEKCHTSALPESYLSRMIILQTIKKWITHRTNSVCRQEYRNDQLARNIVAAG